MFTIRKAQPSDAAKLPAIERSAGEAFRQIAHLAWIADDEVQSVERHLELIGQGTAWVALDDDGPVGFLSAEADHDRLHIWELAVRHDRQGRGIGRRLVETACSWAGEQRFASVTLTTFRQISWNEPFYRSVGFRTLEDEELTPALAAILRHEVEIGLPGSERCAMRRTLG
ncbi:MAG: GNAT family N-acetyltransferase [Sphingomonas bacterium]